MRNEKDIQSKYIWIQTTHVSVDLGEVLVEVLQWALMMVMSNPRPPSPLNYSVII